jgi:signal transduction histidine kinase
VSPSPEDARPRARLGAVLVLALAYFVAGRVALLAAIPPGYAAPAWPAAGIGLVGLLIGGARCWPGVALGSFAVNLGVGFDPSSAQTLALSASSALFIALGAALQALFAAWLVGRFATWPPSPAHPKGMALLAVLGGPVASLVSSLWGPATLLLHGKLAASQLPFASFTWWVGDTIGVFFVLPLVSIWRTDRLASLRRRVAVTMPLAFSLALSVVLFVVVTRHERQRIRIEFENAAGRILGAARDGVNSQLETLRSLRSLYYASDEVEPDEFRIFVAPSLARDDTIRAFSWNERVLDARRTALEREAGVAGGAPLRATELADDGGLVPAPRRAEHVLVRHVEPLADNARVLGYDVLSEPTRARALRRAAEAGDAVHTTPLTLVQDAQVRSAIIVYLPVYEGGETPADAAQRWARVRGFVAAVLDAPRLLAAALRREPDDGIAVALVDDGVASEPRVLASAVPWAEQSSDSAARGALQTTRTLGVPGWSWRLTSVSSPRYVETRWGWQPWAALVSGLFFTGLIGGFLLVMTGRAHLIEELVLARTEDLRRVSRDLLRRNEEIGTVYHTVSHELKTPIASARELVAIVGDGIAGPVNADQSEYLGLAKESMDQMAQLVNELTDVARLETGKLAVQLAPRALAPLLEHVVMSMRGLARERGLELALACEPELPWVRADEGRLAQVLRNLLANALKFTRAGGRVDVTARRDPLERECVRVSVRDTGCGISADDLERVFDRLYQVREGGLTAATSGMGLGLHICQELVRLHGGRIWAESRPGAGSVFSFTLPAADPPRGGAPRPAPALGGARA